MEGDRFSYRYAFAPSADSQKEAEPSQDYLTFVEFRNGVVFAACDGVSQSFFGDLAAQFLGDSLTTWLIETAPPTIDSEILTVSLQTALQDLTTAGTNLVAARPIPNEPLLLREVLLEKQVRGSETMFACGRLDWPGSEFPEGRILLAWMGDMRLHLWRANGLVELGGVHETNQRWSTAKGPVGGSVNLYCRPLELRGNAVTRLIVYSDGLSILDETVDQERLDRSLQRMIDQTGMAPDSDDVTYFELNCVPIELATAPLAAVEPGAEIAAKPPLKIASPKEQAVILTSRQRGRWPLAAAGVFVATALLCGALLLWSQSPTLSSAVGNAPIPLRTLLAVANVRVTIVPTTKPASTALPTKTPEPGQALAALSPTVPLTPTSPPSPTPLPVATLAVATAAPTTDMSTALPSLPAEESPPISSTAFVTQLFLVNPVGHYFPLDDGSTVSLQQIGCVDEGTCYRDIWAIGHADVSSVYFELDDVIFYRGPGCSDRQRSFAAVQNTRLDWRTLIDGQEHTIRAVPCIQSNGGGKFGPALTVSFRVTD